MLRRLVLVVTLGAVALGGCTGDDGPATAAAGRDAASTTTGDQRSSTTAPPPGSTEPGPPPEVPDVDEPADHASLAPWEPCAGSFECTTLTVPRDWSDPGGATVPLAVTRQPALGDRIGSLLLNPGGPGASGVDFVQGFVRNGLPDGLDERFDIVSWDPRGTTGATRIDCTTDAEWLAPDLDPTPDDDDEVDAIRAEAQAGVDACAAAAGDLIPLVGTRATVRDLDALRSLLGDERLTYVGYSYGTTIGMEYLRLFPERVRAMVLDGVAVPGTDPVEDTLVQARGFERTLDVYLAGCAARPACPLGDDPKATMLDLVAQVEGERVPADYELQADDSEPREGTVGPGELYIAVVAALYDTSSWVILDQALSELMDDPATGRTALALRDGYLGRDADGTWVDDSDARGAIRCADQAERSTQPEGDLSLVADWAEELPFWGAWFATGLPGCWGVPAAVDPLLPLADGAIAGAPPVVVLGTTNDPATPFEQAEDAARIIEGSVLVTYEGEVHTAYRGVSDCIDDALTPYLVDLAVPAPDLVC